MVIGIFLLISAARGKHGELFDLIKNDFTGENNFIYWFAAIMAIGAIGYIPKLKPISVALLTLVVLVLVFSKGRPGAGAGLFEKLSSGLRDTEKSKPDQVPSLIVGPGYPVNTAPQGSLQPLTGRIN